MVRGTTRRRRLPTRIVAALVGAALVLANGLLVLVPVLGLVGAAAGAGPVLQVPYGAIAVAIVVGFLVAIACVALAAVARRDWLAWTLVVAAFVASLLGSTWPIVATASAAVDRVGDVIPFIAELIGSLT